MTARTLMIQGTGSDVGKSVLVAGLCRALHRRGIRVMPFKPQNMSNNAAVTKDGGEIGRAQWLQAVAAGVEPTVHMNPVLLKPETDTGAQIIVHGKVKGRVGADYYKDHKPVLLKAVLESFSQLREQADIILVEGAGSASEVNLRSADIANMGFAVAADVPVVIAGDINRGGVIAALVGTHALLTEEERALVKGTIINQFRGDVRLFDGGLKAIYEHTQWNNYGVLPFLRSVKALPSEDAVVLEKSLQHNKDKKLIAVPMLPRIANFDDLDPLQQDPDIDVVFCPPGTPLPQNADLIIIPGSKATITDLRFLKAEGWATDILAFVRAGKPVLGLCGGYQMLGMHVHDQEGAEGITGSEAGLGLLDIETTISAVKDVTQTKGFCAYYNCDVAGYEIHVGKTDVGPAAAIFMQNTDKILGAYNPELPVYGTYLHGVFSGSEFRRAFLSDIGFADNHRAEHSGRVDRALDAVAEDFERHLDIDGLIALAR